MQESPRVGVRWSIISLNGLSYEDSGEYRCQARNMAGISEAPIKLKVVGMTKLPHPSNRRSQKYKPKYSSKFKKSNQTVTATNNSSVIIKQTFQNITKWSLNSIQTAPNSVSKQLSIDKRGKKLPVTEQ